ncbi:MAG: energy transducer TonB [Rhodospirillales bacterium]
MRDAFIYSTLFHAVILVVGYFGLPYIQRAPLMSDAPILVDIVNVDEITNAPPPKAKPEKKPKPEAKKPPPPPKKLAKASPPPPPPPAKKPELAALQPEPTPKAKPKPKPKPEKKAKPKPKPQKRLAKVKPRRKPKPPDAFASVLKTVEKLKDRPPDKKKEKKKEKKETFEQQMAKALSSRSVKNNPMRPIAISEIDLVRQQISECWNLPAGAKEAQDLSIEIRMVMNSDGTVRQARIMDQIRLRSDPFFRAAAESALRAVLNPRCNPLKLPPEKYQQWQNMTLIFDPSQMF